MQKNPPPELVRVNLATVVADIKHSSRIKIKDDVVRRYEAIYRSKPEALPAIDAAKIKDGLVLFDGFHRYQAMLSAGVRIAEINIHSGLKLSELPFQAALANSLHGVQMTKNEYRKKMLGSYIRAKKNRTPSGLKSYREIAADLGNIYSYGTIRRWIQQDFPATFTEMSQDDDADEFKGDDEPSSDSIIFEGALRSIGQLKASYHALGTPETRGELVVAVASSLEELKDHGSWTYQEPDF